MAHWQEGKVSHASIRHWLLVWKRYQWCVRSAVANDNQAGVQAYRLLLKARLQQTVILGFTSPFDGHALYFVLNLLLLKWLEEVTEVRTGKPELAHVRTWSTGASLQRCGCSWSAAAFTCLQILFFFSSSTLLQLLSLTGVYYSPWIYILVEQRAAPELCLADLKPWCGEGGVDMCLPFVTWQDW